MKKRIITLFLAGVIAAGMAGAVSADEAATTERAAGVVFTDESGYTANPYTGYVGGVGLDTTVETLLAALENKNGISVVRDKTLGAADEVQQGDKVVLTAEDGTVKAEFVVVIAGNANSDMKIDLADATEMLKYSAKWENTKVNEIAADVDGNGAVNLADVTLILKKIAKWDVEFVKVPVLPGKGNKAVAKKYQSFVGEAQNPINLRNGEEIGVKFSVAEGDVAKSAEVVCPSWADARGEIRLSLYKWNTDYATTVSAMPIATEKYVNFEDGANLVLDFTDTADKGVGAGEYLWLIHEGYDKAENEEDPEGVGVWQHAAPAADSGLTVYFEGEVVDYGFEGCINLGK